MSTLGHDTYVFQTQGRLRLEFGPGGAESVEGGPGDFVLIPKGVVHREGNPGTEPNKAIVFRVGEGGDPRQRRRPLIGQILLVDVRHPVRCAWLGS